MAKKTLGYVDLEWTCPSCQARNPGTAKVCQQCGAAMPPQASFALPAQQAVDTSAETAARVAAGPDVACPYCGARNRGDAKVCTQCGGDLATGEKRAEGQVLGALQTGPAPEVKCPHCGQANPATALKCSSCGAPLAAPAQAAAPEPAAPPRKGYTLWVVLALAALLVCVFGFFLTRGSKEQVATVKNVAWSYVVQIEELKPVQHEGWRDQLPTNANLLDCTRKVRKEQSEPVPGATELCGTPYVQDTGTGKGQVVQDCVYQVTDDWCTYTVEEWVALKRLTNSGTNMPPSWPAVQLAARQRAGQRSEEYWVYLDVAGKRYTYRPRDLNEYERFVIGSIWTIKTNALGGVVSVQAK